MIQKHKHKSHKLGTALQENDTSVRTWKAFLFTLQCLIGGQHLASRCYMLACFLWEVGKVFVWLISIYFITTTHLTSPLDFS